MLMVQTELRKEKRRIVTWLPQDNRVKVGSVISFEKGGDSWAVTQQGIPRSESSIQRGWGLDLPKSQRTER